MNKQTTTTTKKDHNIEIILKEKKKQFIYPLKRKKNFNKENFNSILVTKKNSAMMSRYQKDVFNFEIILLKYNIM